MEHDAKRHIRPARLPKKVGLSLVALVLGVLVGNATFAVLDHSIVSAQTYDAEVEDIWVDPSTVYAGQAANVYARFHNLESEGGFDVRIEVEPPTGESNEQYLENVAIGSDEKKEVAMAFIE